MKTKNILAAFTLLAASLCPTMAQAQSDEAKMNTFIDNLMNKMTLKEKLGQLNLPVTGDIVTGQAKSSDVASKIKRGEVGGLFNLKGVEKIKEVQKIAVEQSRLHIPLPLRYGRDTWLRDRIPYPLLALMLMGYGSHQAYSPDSSTRMFG